MTNHCLPKSVAFCDRKLEFMERRLMAVSELIDVLEGCYDLEDEVEDMRECVIALEEHLAELRATLGTSDGKVFP